LRFCLSNTRYWLYSNILTIFEHIYHFLITFLNNFLIHDLEQINCNNSLNFYCHPFHLSLRSPAYSLTLPIYSLTHLFLSFIVIFCYLLYYFIVFRVITNGLKMCRIMKCVYVVYQMSRFTGALYLFIS